jgi:hypothetical protein
VELQTVKSDPLVEVKIVGKKFFLTVFPKSCPKMQTGSNQLKA